MSSLATVDELYGEDWLLEDWLYGEDLLLEDWTAEGTLTIALPLLDGVPYTLAPI